jgi:hypothetical protein
MGVPASQCQNGTPEPRRRGKPAERVGEVEGFVSVRIFLERKRDTTIHIMPFPVILIHAPTSTELSMLWFVFFQLYEFT